MSRYRSGSNSAGTVIAVVADIMAVILGLWILMYLLDANRANDLVQFVHHAANWLAGWSRDLFTFDEAWARVVAGYGLAAVVYLFIGHAIANRVHRPDPTTHETANPLAGWSRDPGVRGEPPESTAPSTRPGRESSRATVWPRSSTSSSATQSPTASTVRQSQQSGSRPLGSRAPLKTEQVASSPPSAATARRSEPAVQVVSSRGQTALSSKT